MLEVWNRYFRPPWMSSMRPWKSVCIVLRRGRAHRTRLPDSSVDVGGTGSHKEQLGNRQRSGDRAGRPGDRAGRPGGCRAKRYLV